MLLGPGRLAGLAGFWQAAERVPHLLASASSTKGTSDVFLDTCRNGKCPIHIGAPLGARGREARALLEEAALPTPCKSIYGSLCFPPPPPPNPNKMGAVPLIPAQFTKLCLTKPSSVHPQGLMGTGWMESQHSPRFRQRRPARGGAEVTTCAKSSALWTSLLSPEQGKASKSHRVEEKTAGEESWQGMVCPIAAPGKLLFPPQDVTRL